MRSLATSSHFKSKKKIITQKWAMAKYSETRKYYHIRRFNSHKNDIKYYCHFRNKWPETQGGTATCQDLKKERWTPVIVISRSAVSIINQLLTQSLSLILSSHVASISGRGHKSHTGKTGLKWGMRRKPQEVKKAEKHQEKQALRGYLLRKHFCSDPPQLGLTKPSGWRECSPCMPTGSQKPDTVVV